MSFTPLIVPGPDRGNNADARTVVLRVMNDQPITARLMSELADIFETHKMQVRNSLAGFLTFMEEASDGSHVRIVSNSGMHQIMVWPVGGPTLEKVPHGFLVLTSWSDPVIYGNDGGTWKVLATNPPQAAQNREIVSDNYVVRTIPASSPLLIPLFRQREFLWGNKEHQAHDFGAGKVAVAVALELAGEIPPEVHTLVDNQVRGEEGELLYTATDPPPILLDPEQLHYEPAETDTRSTVAIFHSWRKGTLSASAQVVQFRLASEVIHRNTDVTTYQQVERDVTDLVVQPTGNDAVTTSASSGATLDGDVPALSDLKYNYMKAASSTGYGGGRSIHWLTTFPVVQGSIGTVSSTAMFDKMQQGAGADAVVNNTLVLPTEAGPQHTAWHRMLNYPDRTYWRAGFIKDTAVYTGQPPSPEAYWQTDYKQIQRIDSTHHRDCVPKVWLDIPWALSGEYRLFEGTGTGDITGSFKHDVRRESTNGGGVGFYDDVFAYLSSGDSPGTSPPVGSGMDQFQWDASHVISVSATFNAFAAPYNAGGPGTFLIDKVELHVDNPMTGSLTYTYTSRHLLDFDNRAHFYAALRVEVACSGATWVEDTSVLGQRGYLKQGHAPNYTVKIYLDWCWEGQDGSLLLTQAACTRPGFEFARMEHINMWTWPIASQAVVYYLPPTIAPPEAAAQQLVAAMGQQGTNLYFAGEDHVQDQADKSDVGIEYSITRDGVMESARKWVPGMLYARTFKLADFGDALWLLSATKCDAPQNNDTSGSLPPWFYMPDLGNTIATQTFHVELRDGLVATWSNDITPREGETIPAVNDRTSISIYRV